jgi:hypothetical protein
MFKPSAANKANAQSDKTKDTQLVSAKDAKSDKVKDTKSDKAKNNQLVSAKNAKSDKAKDTQLVAANDAKLGKSNNTVSDPTSQIITTSIDTGGKIIEAGLGYLSKREETKMKELEIREKVVTSIQTMVASFSTQIADMKRGQSDNIKQTADNFTKIVTEALNKCHPEQIDAVRVSRLNSHPSYTGWMSELSELRAEKDKTPEIKASIKELEEKAQGVYDKEDAKVEAQFKRYEKQIDDSKTQFDDLVKRLVDKSSEEIQAVVGLQTKIVELFSQYMSLTFGVKSSAPQQPKSSSVTFEELPTDDKDKVSAKALITGAGMHKPAAIAHIPSSAESTSLAVQPKV